MPKLPDQMARSAQEQINSGNTGTFEALSPGVYTGRFAKIDVTQTKGGENPGSPMWALEFDSIYDLQGNRKPGRQFTNLVIIDSVMWKVGQFFAAFGVPADTDADELINYRCRLNIGTRVATGGSRNGQTVNEINGFQILVAGDVGFDDVVKLSRKLGGSTAGAPAATMVRDQAQQPAASAAPASAIAQQAAQPAAAPAGAPAAAAVPADVDF